MAVLHAKLMGNPKFDQTVTFDRVPAKAFRLYSPKIIGNDRLFVLYYRNRIDAWS